MKDYKKILEGVVNIINTTEKSDIGFANICAYIGDNCPELKESEDDRIRKALIRFHKSTIDIDGIKGDEIVAWLEKQGEQKPFDYEHANIQQKDFAPKVEPKFKVGDLIHNKWSNHSKEIVAIGDYQYTLNDGMPAPPFKVAIKEQDNWELVEQKPAWSEEDEVKINRIVACLKNLNVADNDILLKDVDWLKSLRPQNRWKPSDEQMADLWNMLCECRPADHQLLQDIYYGLKKLKENKL